MAVGEWRSVEIEVPTSSCSATHSSSTSSSGYSSLPPRPSRSLSGTTPRTSSSATGSRLSTLSSTKADGMIGGKPPIFHTTLSANICSKQQSPLVENPMELIPLLPTQTQSVPSFENLLMVNSQLTVPQPSGDSAPMPPATVSMLPKVLRCASLPLLQKNQSMCCQATMWSDVLVLQPLKPMSPPADSPSLNSHDLSTLPLTEGADSEEILEEEAICRICMMELNEGGETLKMECSCKGELALAHKECAVKWFGIRGNSCCDICCREVRNLPVILFRRPSFASWDEEVDFPEDEQYIESSESWHSLAVIILTSALASFRQKLEELTEFP